MRRLVLLLLLILAPVAAADDDDDRDLAFLTFDRYYDVEELAAALSRIHGLYPERTRLESMGQSREGRDLWVMTVFDPASGDPDAKPAMYIDGNTHGNEVQCSEVCLYTIKYLLTRRETPRVKDLLEHVTFFVAPTVNPDGRHRYFHEPHTPHSPRRVLRPVDDDRDGLVDEDGPDDLDGDGHILRMRVRDPNGDHVVDERDDRLMRRRKPGEVGTYRLLGSEGTDEDGDGRINEDAEGGVDPNRNWPSMWRPERDQGGAGPYPLSEPETRATALWLLDRPHVSGVQSYHNAGRMILRPPGAFSDRDARTPAEDKGIYDEIARRGLHVLPSYAWMNVRELYRVFGSFVEWAYRDLGAFSFTNELWGALGREVPDAPEDRQLAALRWNDVALGGEGFVRWRAVKHPVYGEVEVGGWKRFTVRTTPPDFLYETCVRNCLFTLEHAAMLPRLRVEMLEKAEDGALRVRVTNDGVLPTIHAMARRHTTLPPDRLSVSAGAILSAGVERLGSQPPRYLKLKGRVVALPEGIPGKSSIVFRLWTSGSPKGAVYESRVGGVARSPD